MRIAVAALGLGLLAACQPASAPETGAAGEAATATCSAGVTPGIGLCRDADAKLFRATVSDYPLVMPKCVWRTQELKMEEDLYLVFRAQDCGAETQTDTYTYADGRVTMDGDTRILEIFTLPPGMDAQAFSLTKLDTAPEAERKRCIIRPLEHGQWEIGPDDAFLEELKARQEPWSACGEYGDPLGSERWEARGPYALFYSLGFDAAGWDMDSFTFYRKGADGSWAKLPD